MVTRCARRSRTVRSNVFRSSASSTSRPTSGAARGPDGRPREGEGGRGRQRREVGDAAERDDAAHARRLELDGRRGQTLGPSSDEDLARLRELAKTGSDPDRTPGIENRARLVGQDLACLDADSALDAEIGYLRPEL